LKLNTIFAIATGTVNVPEALPLARKIFADNQNLLVRGVRTWTNFIRQNPNKHIIRETYLYPNDVEKLKIIIVRWGVDYLKSVGFHMDFYTYTVKNLWLNEYRDPEDHQAKHNHTGYLISGTYYVDMPPGTSPILFHNPRPEFSEQFTGDDARKFDQYNSDYWLMRPNEGDMIFWNSNLHHEVPNHGVSEVRRTISFDITVDRYTG